MVMFLDVETDLVLIPMFPNTFFGPATVSHKRNPVTNR